MPNPLYDALFAPHRQSDAPFLISPDRRSLSYRGFLDIAARFALALTDQGLAPGERVCAQVEKSPEALALYVACLQAGLVYLPLNTGYTPSEVGYFLTDSGAKVFVCDPAAQATTPDDFRGTSLSLGAEGAGTLPDTARAFAPDHTPVDRDEEDLAGLLYTSGTTGRSKGAMMTHRNLLSNARALKELWQFTNRDVLLHALPIFHTHGLFVASNVLACAGGAMIFLPKFDIDAVFDTLPMSTSMMGVPTFYTRMLDDRRLTREATRHMRLFISGSAPLLEETHTAFEAATGQRILERYGMTETNMITSNPYHGPRRGGTVGTALPGVEVKVTDPDTGAGLPTGQTGQIEVRGPNVFQGYWNMPEKTAEEIRPDGFFVTGDLGVFDEDGYLTIVGRAKDLIISGGYNIYPKELELVLDAQTGVLESAVIGVPHPDFGETPVAVLVAEAGQSPDLDAIRAAMSDALARFKLPRHYETIDALPRNAMGKVQKNALRAQFGNLFKDTD